MVFKELSLRLEIGFWQLVISLMYESAWVQSLIRWSYHRLFPILRGFNQFINTRRVVTWGIFGFFTGLIVSVIIGLL